MNVFNVNFDKLNLELLPTFLRKPLLFAFLQAKTAPIERVWHEFLIHQADIFFLLKYNPSKRNVEIALRRRFNDEGIFIQNAKPNEGLHLDFYLPAYIENAGHETQTETAYLNQYLPFYLEKEIPADDFTIFVPKLTYITNRQAIFDFAGFFVLPGFRYSIKPILN